MNEKITIDSIGTQDKKIGIVLNSYVAVARKIPKKDQKNRKIPEQSKKKRGNNM